MAVHRERWLALCFLAVLAVAAVLTPGTGAAAETARSTETPPAPAPDCDANGACLDESYDEYGEDEDDEAEDADADADADGEAEDVDVAEAEGVNNGVSPIAALTPFEFDHLVVYPQGPVQFDWLIHFKTDWCERCNEAEEVITNVAQVFVDEHAAAAGNQTALESETFVRVGEVDCGWYPSICSQFSAMSYPTIALVTHTDKTVYLYEGDRQHADELYEFVIKRGQGQGLIKFAGTISDSMPQEWTKYTMIVVDNYMIMLERYIETLEFVQDPLINAIIVGVLLGGVLVLPMLIISFTFSLIDNPRLEQQKALIKQVQQQRAQAAAGAGGSVVFKGADPGATSKVVPTAAQPAMPTVSHLRQRGTATAQ